MFYVNTPLMTPKKYAELSGLSVAGVKKLIADGRLPSVKLGDSRTSCRLVNVAKLTMLYLEDDQL